MDYKKSLRWWRKSHLKQSMKEFAKQVGVHPNTIQNLERNGFQGCTVETLKKIIDYIGIGFNDLDTDHKSNSHKE